MGLGVNGHRTFLFCMVDSLSCLTDLDFDPRFGRVDGCEEESGLRGDLGDKIPPALASDLRLRTALLNFETASRTRTRDCMAMDCDGNELSFPQSILETLNSLILTIFSNARQRDLISLLLGLCFRTNLSSSSALGTDSTFLSSLRGLSFFAAPFLGSGARTIRSIEAALRSI